MKHHQVCVSAMSAASLTRNTNQLCLRLTLAIGISLTGCSDQSSEHQQTLDSATQGVPPEPVPDSPFLNTTTASYVGSNSCRECHAGVHAHFRTSGMGRSTSLVDPQTDPAPAMVAGGTPGAEWHVRHVGDSVHHQKLHRTASGAAVVRVDEKVKWQIGSGRHARSYMTDDDGFLSQSPLTWFERTQHWDFSPGYDLRHGRNFERRISETCLRCHTGDSRSVPDKIRKVRIVEPWISCERCHGPGSLHVETHARAADPALNATDTQGIDYTIVNPSHLSRELSDDICAQCHGHGEAIVSPLGKTPLDFRPGLPLAAFHLAFDKALEQDKVPVVGHIEQMRASECYAPSTMSCVTCHKLHTPFSSVEEKRLSMRATCLECHEPESCSVLPDTLHKQSPDNDCLKCHMPQADTDVAHVAFTQHRIGIYDGSESPAENGTDQHATDHEIVCYSNLSYLTPTQQQRAFGLAYANLLQVQETDEAMRAYQQRASAALFPLWDQASEDPELAANLAMLAGLVDDPRTISVADTAIENPDATLHQKVKAWLAQSGWYWKRQDAKRALAAMRLAAGKRRQLMDHVFIAHLETLLGNRPAAIEALETVLEINPLRDNVRQELIQYYRTHNNLDRARELASGLPSK